jgi:hypothetical protein
MRFQLQVCAQDGTPHAQAIDFAVGKEFFAATDTAHVETFEEHRVALVGNDDLGTAAADIDHQAATAIALQGLRGAEIYQAGLLDAGNDFDRKSEGLLRFGDELARILRLAQRIGTDDPKRARQPSARSLASGVNRPLASSPAASRTMSRSRSITVIPCSSACATFM